MVPVQLQDFDVTCSCANGSDGCRPYTNPTANGCVPTGPSTNCTQTNSTRMGGKDVELSDGAVIDLSSDIHFIPHQTELSQTPPAYASLFFDSTVIQSLRSFIMANGTSAAFDVADMSTDGHLGGGLCLSSIECIWSILTHSDTQINGLHRPITGFYPRFQGTFP